MAKANKLIASYGTEEDRLRAALIAKRRATTISKLILTYIRDEYRKVYGEADPHDVTEIGE